MGAHSIKHESCEIKKKSNAIDSIDKKGGDNRFRRFEFWGVGTYFMLHYLGDDAVYISSILSPE